MDNWKERKIKDAMEQCDHYIKNNAKITVVENDFNSITLHEYNTDAVDVILQALKEVYFWYPQLVKSDLSKELSSMNYYNEMRYWEDRAKFMTDIAGEMLKYIAEHNDCPLENEGVDIECEHRCSTEKHKVYECWQRYFDDKVVIQNEQKIRNRNKGNRG